MNWLNKILAIIAIGFVSMPDNQQQVLATSDDNTTVLSTSFVGIMNDKQILKQTNQLRSDDEPSDCQCGERNDPPRIVGGKATKANEFPWMARITYLDKFYCAGSLINDFYVLTAAHCVHTAKFTRQWSLMIVRLGEHNICKDKTGFIERYVVHARSHDFNLKNFADDIALLKLNERVPFSSMVRPICLPTLTDDLFVDRIGTITGWGSLEEDGATACELQEVQLPILSNEVCRTNTDYKSNSIVDSMMCAGYLNIGKKDACQSDSGGPLTLEKEDKRLEIVGITSWGKGCGRARFPGVFTRVTKYLDWINEHSKEGSFCKS